MSLDEYLKQNKIVGIEGIDTRALTRRLRIDRTMRGVLSSEITDDAQLVERARTGKEMAGADWVQAVKPTRNTTGTRTRATGASGKVERGDGLHVVALDCGAKSNILRHLVERGVKVTVLPPDTTAEEIMRHRPDGLFVSNGPGDPAALDYAVKPIKDVLDRLPTFGICLGTSSSAGRSARRRTS
jgi:carbamoyl-phosphate synthase small subunit